LQQQNPHFLTGVLTNVLCNGHLVVEVVVVNKFAFSYLKGHSGTD